MPLQNVVSLISNDGWQGGLSQDTSDPNDKKLSSSSSITHSAAKSTSSRELKKVK